MITKRGNRLSRIGIDRKLSIHMSLVMMMIKQTKKPIDMSVIKCLRF